MARPGGAYEDSPILNIEFLICPHLALADTLILFQSRRQITPQIRDQLFPDLYVYTLKFEIPQKPIKIK